MEIIEASRNHLESQEEVHWYYIDFPVKAEVKEVLEMTWKLIQMMKTVAGKRFAYVRRFVR